MTVYKGWEITEVFVYTNGKSDFERWNPESERGILEHMRTLEEIKSDIDDETEDYA